MSSVSSRLQTICGGGYPLASHSKVTFSPSLTTREVTPELVILGGTKRKFDSHQINIILNFVAVLIIGPKKCIHFNFTAEQIHLFGSNILYLPYVCIMYLSTNYGCQDQDQSDIYTTLCINLSYTLYTYTPTTYLQPLDSQTCEPQDLY